MTRPRILLIRENAETLTCSNCGGTLEGIDAFGRRRVPDYEPIRSLMVQMGQLYQALRREFGDRVNVEVVDPRNSIYLFPVLLVDYWRYRPPLGRFLRTLFLGVTPASIIVNATTLCAGSLPSPQELVNKVSQRVKASELTQTSVP
jgi:hypothetical protein